MSEKVFLKCSAKARKYGVSIGVKAEDLIAFAKAHANERGYVNLMVKERREVGQYGDTHSVVLDDYQPKPQTEDVAF